MVYEQPNHCLTLDRFMQSYEKKYSCKIPSHFYGRPKLLKLLEDFTDTLEISGTGPSRLISLKKIRLFACEMTELLLPHQEPMPISKIRPAYKEKFMKDLVVTEYGHPKLIKLLEEIPEVIDIHGTGASRTVTLKTQPRYTSLFSCSPSAGVQASPATLEPLTDEVMAILLTTHSQKMSLLELTKGYNQAFRSQGLKRDSVELLQAIRKLPNFKVTGAGPTCYVQVAQVVTPPRSSVSKSEPGDVPNPAKVTPAKNVPPAAQKHETAGEIDADMYEGMPKLVTETARKKLFEQPALASELPIGSATSAGVTPPQVSEEEAKRLSSETRRLLLCHQEHAMTLAELVECFAAMGEPTEPNAESLYQALKNHGGNTGEGSTKFVISYFSSDVGGSLVQLNPTDCLWKLGCDLVQLFVFRPTADLSLPVASLEALYAEYFSRKLLTAVYAAKDIHQVLRAKQMRKVIQVVGDTCSPCGVTKELVLANLLTELLFALGEKCHSVDSLPQLYQDYFKAPLPFHGFDVRDLTSLMKLAKVEEAISLVSIPGCIKPVLNSSTLFVEQLRHMLTKHDGRIALDHLETIYIAEFGHPTSPEVQKYIRKKLPHFSFHVVNLASYKWAVWSPTGYPCCPQRWTGEVLASESSMSHSSVVVTSQEPSTCITVVSEQVNPSDSFVDDLVDLSDVPTVRKADSWPELTEENTSMSSALEPGGMFVAPKTQKTGDLIDLSDTLDISELDMSALDMPALDMSALDLSVFTAAEGIMKLDESGDGDLSFASALPPSSCVSTADVEAVDPDPAPEAPFDFLKQHPELVAELSKTDSPIPVDDLAVLAEVLTLQRLQELGIKVPQSGGGVTSPSPQVQSVLEEEVPVLPPESSSQPIDYLKLGWNPSQVLAELQRQKKGCGGILPPDKMEPFLDYFGEMSSRELDRMESQEGKQRPKKSVTGGRMKRNMAIRFPSQSDAATAPSKSLPQEHPTSYDIPTERLPVADMENSSSDSDGSSVVPLDRNEYIRKFLKGEKLPNDIIDPDMLLAALESSEDKDADTAYASGSGLDS